MFSLLKVPDTGLSDVPDRTGKALKKTITAIAIASMAGLGCLAYSNQAMAADDDLAEVTFMLDFSTMGRHAPWYVAVDKGYFKDAGLDVKIVPGQGTAQSLQALEADVAQFAFSDVNAQVLGRARGVSSGVFIEMNYQKAPYAIFSLKDGANIDSLDKIQGTEIASSSSSSTPNIIKGLMSQNNLDASNVTFSNVAPPARPGMLLTGKIPAIETFVFGQVGMQQQDKDNNLVTLLLADHGLTLYSDGVLVKEDYMEKNPELVKGFVEASLKGWQYALNNMEEAADIQIRHVPSLNKDTVIGELEILKQMAVTPSVEKHGLGYINPDEMAESVKFVVDHIGVEGTVPPIEDLYTNKFQPEKPVMP